MALGQSQFVGKLGTMIANPKVTAIDDGTIPNGWGSVNIDDEGTPAQKKILIDKGILKTYMVESSPHNFGMWSVGLSKKRRKARDLISVPFGYGRGKTDR